MLDLCDELGFLRYLHDRSPLENVSSIFDNRCTYIPILVTSKCTYIPILVTSECTYMLVLVTIECTYMLVLVTGKATYLPTNTSHR